MLIDQRDCSHISDRVHSKITHFGDKSGLVNLPDMDYVAHEDIIPYVSQDSAPIQHELFGTFFTSSSRRGADDTNFEAQPALSDFQEKDHQWLELSDVYKETTEGIRVTVIPFCMGSKGRNHDYQGTKSYWVSTDLYSV